ncbi:amino acid ABC transporter permease [Candidatus Pelagibacter sp. Uisw_127]|uniref:amino acid ABC transporter permease n=1 Tax=Candidatus Pelagibacter sp. Uisw_127 TaxID=3230988 RepID=UPI0039E957A2
MKLKKILPQLLTLLFIVIVFGFFTMNAQENMGARGLEFGFGFLKTQASFDIQFSLIDYDGSHTYARAYLVGLLNTLLVAFIGIILATLLGAIVGVARLSPNYLIRKTASFYIEFFRNIPLLLQIFFWYFAALRALPMLEDAPMLLNSSFMTIKGLYTPAPIWTNFDVFFTTIIIAMIIIFFFARYAKKKQEQEGKRLPVLIISLAIFIGLPLLTFLIGGVDLSWSFPVIRQMSQSSYTFDGGLKIPPELIALTLALTLYTATFIAENVRAGIQGIGKGQKEAAASIGLTPGQVLKLVVMPQALRIIIPPTTNQYLNLTKNSSLAAAIAYPDLVLVFAGTAMMQTGRAIEIVGITMATYLTISLSISLLMNWYNKRIAIQEK